MAAFQRRRASDPVKSNVRIPAWAIARRLSGRLTVSPQGSPDSMAKRTVQTLPSEDDESLVLPRMEGGGAQRAAAAGTTALRLSATSCNSTSTATLLLLKMDVTGFRVEDLHLDVDTQTKKLCLAGMGPRMFKRSFPVPSYDQVDMTKLSASLVAEDRDRSSRCYLMIQAPSLVGGGEDDDDEGTVNSQGRRSIRIKDETRPPTLIEIPGP